MIEPGAASLLVALPATLVHLLATGATVRVAGARFVLPIMVGWGLGLLAAAALLGGSALSFWHLAAFIGCGAVANLFAFGSVHKSISLDMLLTIDRVPDGRASADELAVRVVEPAFDERIAILLGNGRVIADTDRYRATGDGTATAGRLDALRRFLAVETAGLYDPAEPDATTEPGSPNRRSDRGLSTSSE